jgi:hypothetical protein
MDEIAEEIVDGWAKANTEQIERDTMISMVIHGWHLAPGLTQ